MRLLMSLGRSVLLRQWRPIILLFAFCAERAACKTVARFLWRLGRRKHGEQTPVNRRYGVMAPSEIAEVLKVKNMPLD